MKVLINLLVLSLIITSTINISAADETIPSPGIVETRAPAGNGSTAPQACSGRLLIDQGSDQDSAFTADDECDFNCVSPQQSITNNIVLGFDSTISELAIWGGYFPTNIISSDNFTVIFHTNEASTNLPGIVISTQNSVASTRVSTGNTINVVGNMISEQRWVLILNQPVSLSAGTYWIEIFNSTPGSDDFVWGSSDADSMLASPIAFDANAAPGQNWTAFVPNRALQVCGSGPFEPIAVPMMSKPSTLLLLFMVAFGVIMLKPKRATAA